MSSTGLTSGDIDIRQIQDQILERLTDGVYFVDQDRRILYWNPAAEKMTGYSREQVVGTSCADGRLSHVDSDGNCLCKDHCPLVATMKDGQSRDTHVFMHHADGHYVPVYVRSAAIYGRDNQILGSVEVFSDDTQRIQILDRLREMDQVSLVDELTGLGNRRYFNRSLSASMASYSRHGTGFGVILMDVDHFKQFNDTYGHALGDQVLRVIAMTLRRNCRAYDVPIRWGGEEFVVIAPNTNASSLFATAQRLRKLISASSTEHNGHPLSITVSMGCTMVQPKDDAETMMDRVDQLLFASKHGGRNQVSI